MRRYLFENNEIKTLDTAFENTDEEKKIEMLQAMFHYATISNDKKNWLLRLLRDKVEEKHLYSVLKSELREEIKDILLGEVSFWSVSNKIFYYFEYMLWEIYYDYVKGEDKVVRPEAISPILTKIDKVKGHFRSFYFKQLPSKEHLLPQSKKSSIDIDKILAPDKKDEEQEKILHCFGNLCLISSYENSSANNEHPKYKKESFYNNTSLKRLMMFETFSGNEWNTQDIKQHQEEMEALLKFYQSSKE